MNTVMETITSVEDRVAELAETAQQPVVDLVTKVDELVEGILPEDRPSLPFTLPFADAMPERGELIENQFAFAQRILDIQHGFAKAIAAAAAPLYGTPAKPAKPVAKAAKAA